MGRLLVLGPASCTNCDNRLIWCEQNGYQAIKQVIDHTNPAHAAVLETSISSGYIEAPLCAWEDEDGTLTWLASGTSMIVDTTLRRHFKSLQVESRA